MSVQEYRPLIIRSNRAVGAMLLEKKLITTEQLETANEKLLENVEKGELRRANILHVLIFEMQVLNDDAYLEAVVEKHGLSLMDLHGCQFKKFADLHTDFAACWATWTVPFDLVEDFYMLATAFYPSPPAVKFWTEKYAGKNILWYATPVRSFQAAMERLENMKGEASRAAAAKAPTKGSTKSPIPAKKA